MNTCRIIFLSFALPLAASAQLLTFGAIGGVPAQPPLGETIHMPFAVGPTVTIRALSRLSVESGVLYHRLGEREDNYTLLYPENAVTLGWERRRSNAIELPFLVKYSLLGEGRRWQPFVLAGPAVRRTSIDSWRLTSVLSRTDGSSSPGSGSTAEDETVKWKVDPVVGAGVSLRAGRFHMEPQVRYSYWSAGKHSPVLQNQMHILLGLRF